MRPCHYERPQTARRAARRTRVGTLVDSQRCGITCSSQTQVLGRGPPRLSAVIALSGVRDRGGLTSVRPPPSTAAVRSSAHTWAAQAWLARRGGEWTRRS